MCAFYFPPYFILRNPQPAMRNRFQKLFCWTRLHVCLTPSPLCVLFLSSSRVFESGLLRFPFGGETFLIVSLEF